MNGVIVTPTPFPTDWLSTAAPGAAPVVVTSFAPSAISTGEVAILGVVIVSGALIVLLLIMLLLRRSV